MFTAGVDDWTTKLSIITLNDGIFIIFPCGFVIVSLSTWWTVFLPSISRWRSDVKRSLHYIIKTHLYTFSGNKPLKEKDNCLPQENVKDFNLIFSVLCQQQKPKFDILLIIYTTFTPCFYLFLHAKGKVHLLRYSNMTCIWKEEVKEKGYSSVYTVPDFP